MLHTGFDAPANSLELQCIKRCVQKVFGVFDKLGVPYNQNGSIMVAWNPEQVLLVLLSCFCLSQNFPGCLCT